MNKIKKLLSNVAIVLMQVLSVSCNTNQASTKKKLDTDKDSETLEIRPKPKAVGNTHVGDKIKIGLVASLTGPLKTWGMDSLHACRLAIDECNANGGIHGMEVDLLVEDCASKPEQAPTATHKLYTAGILGVIGDASTGINMQIAKVAYDTGIPHISSNTTNLEFTHEGSNIYRVCHTNDVQGGMMALFAYHDLGVRRISVLTDRTQPFSVVVSKEFIKKFEQLGGTVTTELFYETGQCLFSGQLTNIKATNPDALFMSGYFTEVGVLARQALEIGLDVPMLGGDGWDCEELVKSGIHGIEGGYLANQYSNDEQREAVQHFVNLWEKEYGSPPATNTGAMAYDAICVMLDALRRCESLNSANLCETLESTEGFESVSGTITFKNVHGDPHKGGVVQQIKNGELVHVKRYQHELILDNEDID